MKFFKKFTGFFVSDEQKAYDEAHYKECVKLAKKKGQEDAKKKYKK